MQRQKAAILAGRRRQSVTFGRVAAWVGFASAVCSQGAILVAGCFLADPDFPYALRNAAIAGAVAVLGLVATVMARRVGKRAQTSAVNLGRVPLRLVVDLRDDIDIERSRPAA